MANGERIIEGLKEAVAHAQWSDERLSDLARDLSLAAQYHYMPHKSRRLMLDAVEAINALVGRLEPPQ